MDIEKLIERLQNAAGGPEGIKMCNDAATALSTLYEENAEMQKHLNEFSEFLCHMTGGLLSKTNYTAQEMISAAEDYQQNVCGECDLRAENEKLRAELEQVKAERDAAVDCCSGYCASCLFVKDCAKHDMNDAAPTRWYYGDCEDWEWRGWKEG